MPAVRPLRSVDKLKEKSPGIQRHTIFLSSKIDRFQGPTRFSGPRRAIPGATDALEPRRQIAPSCDSVPPGKTTGARGSSMADFDLAIIGGGINGPAIARAAPGRGMRVLLVEQSDLASATSSASTKLIHGGLRYLEQGAFRLVREALAEREVLLRNAPHLIRPLRFVLPHHDGLRPAWQLRV